MEQKFDILHFINILRDRITTNKTSSKLLANLDILDTPLEVGGIIKPLIQHVGVYIQHLSPLNKLQLITSGIKTNVKIDPNTFKYESIDTICEDVIIGMITA